MTKNVYLEGRIPGWKLHSLYDSIIDFPPEGFVVHTDSSRNDGRDGRLLRSINGRLSDFQSVKKIMDYLVPTAYYSYYRMMRFYTKQPPTDLIYSSQHLLFDDTPWIVDLEFVTSLVGYGSLARHRRLIEKILSSQSCKKIIPWTNAGAKTLECSLDCRGFENKIETVYLAPEPKTFERNKTDDKVRLLFVGTGNSFNIRKSFEIKGGREAILAFARLREEYENLELTIRSNIPDRYAELCRRHGIRTLSEVLSPQQLQEEFEDSDIFVFPGHQTPGMVILDAMSYGLPVVATDVWGTREMVVDNKTGLLTKPSRFAEYFDDNFVPQWGEPRFQHSIERVDQEMVEDIVSKVSVLVEDEIYRRELGENGRRETAIGKFSVVERNKNLGRIFKESLNA